MNDYFLIKTGMSIFFSEQSLCGGLTSTSCPIPGGIPRVWHRAVPPPLNLENAVQPRMGTDGHGCQALGGGQRLTRRVNEARHPKSVFIRVNPWLMISLSDSNCGI
jgi:hypothetical protein